MTDFDPKPKYKKGDRVWSESAKQYGTLTSGPILHDKDGKRLGCWFCHKYKCDGACGGELFGDRCARPECRHCEWAEREHGYTPTRMQ